MNNFEIAKAGVLLACKLLEIKKIKVEFMDRDLFPYEEINALFLKEKFVIVFNKDWLLNAKYLDILYTSFHEARHAYQYLQIIKKSSPKLIEDEDVINIWSKEFNEYIQPNQHFDTKYIHTNIEIDAIAFSKFLLSEIFNADLLVPRDIITKVDKRIEDIKRIDILVKHINLILN